MELVAGGLLGEPCDVDALSLATRGLVRFRVAGYADSLGGAGVLIAPNWVITCAHVAWPSAPGLQCVLVSDTRVVSEVEWLYNERLGQGIGRGDFSPRRFPVDIWGSRSGSEYALEGLALLRIEPAIRLDMYPEFTPFEACCAHSAVGFATVQGQCYPRLTTGLRYSYSSLTTGIVCTVDQSILQARYGDSGGAVWVDGQEGALLVAIQNAINKHPPPYMSHAVPVLPRQKRFNELISTFSSQGVP